MIRKVVGSLWLGASLTTLFFYPLISAIADEIGYLQWQPANNLELLLAFAVVGIGLGTLLLATESIGNGRLRLLATLAICAVPFASFVVHVVRQLGLKGLLAAHADLLLRHRWAALPVALLLSTGIGLLVLRHHQVVRAAMLNAALIMSPLSVFSAVTVLRSGLDFTPIQISERPGVREAAAPVSGLPNVVALVFDELDYEYLYAGSQVRADFPHIRAFAAGAENYHAARAPGDETLTSMIGLIAGRPLFAGGDARERGLGDGVPYWRSAAKHLSRDSVFASARERGYRTALYGWLHPYCMMLEGALDSCRSFSIYNYSTINEPVSILNPIYTNIILWPHQQPFGALKNPVYSVYQHRVVTRTYDLAVASLGRREPVFCLVHFSIPHLPFVYEGDHYRPAADPFLQNSENYVRQLGYVDYLVGRFLADMQALGMLDRSHVVLTSDHGYRIMRQGDEKRRVPLIIKRAFRSERRDIQERIDTETVLPGLIALPGR